MNGLSLEEINRLDIVDFLAGIGIHPQKVSGNSYWYLSPLPHRLEKTPSFKVNRAMNRWWDFGTGEGSTLVDFGIRYFDCTIRELKEKLSRPALIIPSHEHPNVPHHYPIPAAEPGHAIQILHTYPIRSFYLLQYLWERRIPVNVAQQYCLEAQYTFGSKPYYAIGFKCDAGGYELRNKFHKYSTHPKSPTRVSHHSMHIAIFEGFFDMLTFVSVTDASGTDLPDLLVLNSVAFLPSFFPAIESYGRKHLFLDNTPAGDKFTKIALAMNCGYTDHRMLYKGYKDLNEWACHIGQPNIHDLSNNTPRSP